MTGPADVRPHDREFGPHDLVAGYYTISGSRTLQLFVVTLDA